MEQWHNDTVTLLVSQLNNHTISQLHNYTITELRNYAIIQLHNYTVTNKRFFFNDYLMTELHNYAIMQLPNYVITHWLNFLSIEFLQFFNKYQEQNYVIMQLRLVIKDFLVLFIINTRNYTITQ